MIIDKPTNLIQLVGVKSATIVRDIVYNGRADKVKAFQYVHVQFIHEHMIHLYTFQRGLEVDRPDKCSHYMRFETKSWYNLSGSDDVKEFEKLYKKRPRKPIITEKQFNNIGRFYTVLSNIQALSEISDPVMTRETRQTLPKFRAESITRAKAELKN